MTASYANCSSCGVPILQRTFDRTGGFCKNCSYREDSPPDRLREFPAERFDPLESDPNKRETIRIAYELAIDAAEAEIRAEFPGSGFCRDDLMMGFCHVVWRHKKRILREQFGLEWQSPAELNPHIWYD